MEKISFLNAENGVSFLIQNLRDIGIITQHIDHSL